MDEDYFGNVQVPVDEEEDDAANDLTFCDIGDIRAGDEASDVLWEPENEKISSKIEAEKKALQQQRTLSSGPALRSPSNVTEGHAPLLLNQSAASPNTSWSQISPLKQPSVHPLPPQQPLAQSHLLQPPFTQQLRGPQQASHPLQQSVSSLLQHGNGLPQGPPVSQLPQMPQMSHLSQMSQLSQVPQQPPSQYHAQSQPPVSFQEYERTMMSYYESHTRDLLLRHKETAEQQLREAQAAQRAGVVFDRNKFDEHQNAIRQRILSEHYTHVNHLRYVVWHQSQQLAQLIQKVQEQDQPQPQRTDVLDLAAKTPSTSRPNTSRDTAGKRSDRDDADILSRVQLSLQEETTRYQAKPTQSMFSQTHSRSNGHDAEKAPRLIEIERQMAAAGLGPSKTTSNRDTFDIREKTNVGSVSKKKERRLESMTDKDQELVFRVHLRQVESSVIYKDDYYNAMLRKKEKLGGHEIYSDLAEKVHAMRLRTRQRGGEGRPIRPRRSKKSASNGEAAAAASPPHSDHNMKALATALGTVQSWNPRAPRRVMDFGVMEKRNEEEKEPHTLLRDDERVHVRQEIERGYDVIATIHDIVRGESSESLEAQILALMTTLHIDESKAGQSSESNGKPQETQFFATMCVIEKGRGYLARVAELLDVADRLRVMRAIFENLGAMIFAKQKTPTVSGDMQRSLFTLLGKTLQDPEVSPHDCLTVFHSFIQAHTSHHDALLTTFRSSVGSKLVFLCMQRISRGFYKGELDEDELSRENMEEFSKVFTQSLQDIFEGAESVGRVWEVIASMDGLARGDHKVRYRAELNRLLRSGAAPPPPGTKPMQH